MSYEDEGKVLTRDCPGILIPNGTRTVLGAGLRVFVHQSLGGSYTVSTETGYLIRLNGEDGDAIGMERIISTIPTDPNLSLEERVWGQLKSVYDPEIPVNIVDLGLIYLCEIFPLNSGGVKVDVRLTVTAPGCGMGDILKVDVEDRLKQIPEVKELDVELVLDPPWSQDLMTEAARLALNLY